MDGATLVLVIAEMKQIGAELGYVELYFLGEVLIQEVELWENFFFFIACIESHDRVEDIISLRGLVSYPSLLFDEFLDFVPLRLPFLLVQHII